jgi:hypothetical protein
MGMNSSQYKINTVITLFKEKKDQEAYELLKTETRKVVADFKEDKITEEEICELYTPLYSQISSMKNERTTPSWVWDLLIESVDMHVSQYPFDIQSIENIVAK